MTIRRARCWYLKEYLVTAKPLWLSRLPLTHRCLRLSVAETTVSCSVRSAMRFEAIARMLCSSGCRLEFGKSSSCWAMAETAGSRSGAAVFLRGDVRLPELRPRRLLRPRRRRQLRSQRRRRRKRLKTGHAMLLAFATRTCPNLAGRAQRRT